MPRNQVTTRPAKIDEVGTLYEMICELAVYERKDPKTLPVTKENLIKFFPYYRTELALVDDEIVGYALYSYNFSASQGRPFLFLDDLYVRPHHRNQGIGKRLLHRLTEYAKEVGCCRLEWGVFEWNEKAIEFYKSLGANLRKDITIVRWEN
jgi:GNAT superfamily N-acetyltransferase